MSFPDTAAAIGVTYLFRATGSVLGIAVSTSILQQSLKSNLTKYFSGKHADTIIDRIRQNVDYIRELQGNERAAAIASYWAAMHNVFLAIMIAAILAVSRLSTRDGRSQTDLRCVKTVCLPTFHSATSSR